MTSSGTQNNHTNSKNQCYKNRFGEKIAGVQKTTFRKNRQNIRKLKKIQKYSFFLIFETFKATIASNRQIATRIWKEN
jgi:hypothetical protein